jgi:hypothetical protein
LCGIIEEVYSEWEEKRSAASVKSSESRKRHSEDRKWRFIQMPFLSRLAQTISAKDAGLYAIEFIGFYRRFSDSESVRWTQLMMHLSDIAVLRPLAEDS